MTDILAKPLARASAPAAVVIDKDNVDSEVGPGQLTRQIPDPDDREKAAVRLVLDRVNDGQINRRPHDARAFVSWAYYIGNQTCRWDGSSRRLVSARNPSRPYSRYGERNKIRGKVNKTLARALHTEPDSTVAPLTDSEMDRAHALMARALLRHYDQKLGSQAQLWKMLRWALTTTTAFLKQWWDPKKRVEVPIYGPDGVTVIGSKVAAVGDLCEEIIPWYQLVPDPKAHSFDKAGWICQYDEPSLEYVKLRWERGWLCEPTMGSDAMSGFIDSMVASVTGDYRVGSEPGQAGKSTRVVEMRERPTELYPEGRLFTIAGDRSMRFNKSTGEYWDPWEGDDREHFCYVPLHAEDPQGTFFAPNQVWDMCGAQRSYNEGVSRVDEHMQTSWGKIMAPKGCYISSTAFDSAKPNEVIYYEPGPGIPQHLPAPDLPPVIIENLKIADSDIADISGIHDVSEGNVPPGVSAAAAIQLLQQADTTQMASMTRCIENFVEARDNGRLRLLKTYIKEPRLLFVAQTSPQKPALSKPGARMAPPIGPPMPPGAPPVYPPAGGGQAVGPGVASPGLPGPGGMAPAPSPPPQPGPPPSPFDDLPPAVMQAFSFEHFAQGSCRVSVTPGSATPRSPEARFEEVMKMATEGLLGPVGDPTTAGIVFELLDYADPDVIIEKLEAARMKALQLAQSMQPDPMAIEQMKMQQQLQLEAETEAIKTHSAITVLQAKREIAAELEGLKAKDGQLLAQSKSEEALKLAMFKAHFEMLRDQQKPPAVALKGDMGSTATPSAEKLAGLDPDSSAEILKANAPPALGNGAGAAGKGGENGKA